MSSVLSFGSAAPPRARVALASRRRSAPAYSASRRCCTMASAQLGYDANFGPASGLDATVFGACRPGGAGGEERTE